MFINKVLYLLAYFGVSSDGPRPVILGSLPFFTLMTPSERSATVDVVQRVKHQIARLTEEQSKALQLSIYVGMSRDETKKYDERLNQIKKLLSESARLVAKL